MNDYLRPASSRLLGLPRGLDLKGVARAGKDSEELCFQST